MNVYFESLGCDKNLVDSETMILALRKAGFVLVDEPEKAEVIVVNTCCFIGDAKEESINTLLELAQYKDSDVCKLLAAAGCLAQRYHEEIKEELPEVDLIIGTTGYEGLVSGIYEALDSDVVVEKLEDIDYLPKAQIERDSMTGGYYAYLKIAEGCDKCCTYCAIPKVRGRYRSFPVEELVLQAVHLVENGAKELILVAQETTLYGRDIYGKKSLPMLLEKLSEISGLKWIRILYCYPEEITDELIDTIKKLPKVCNYLDIPIQHSSDSVLKRMGRKTNKAALKELILKLRREIPDIALRTTLITGFPGETESDFDELMEFVREMKFERLGVFAYSQEEGTKAELFDGQIPEDIKNSRKDCIMELQQQIASENGKLKVGNELEVMVEGRLPEEDIYIARTYMDAPDVDGYVFVDTDKELMSGDFINVTITGSDSYDLIAEMR